MARKPTHLKRGKRGKVRMGDKKLSGVDVVVLAGGLGTRLQSVFSGKPKVLAPVGGKSFLGIVLERIFPHNPRRVILSVGHLKDQIKRYVEEQSKVDKRFQDIVFSEEDRPLGTGGALKLAGKLVRGEDFVAMNGDTLHNIDLPSLLRFHKEKGNTISIAVVRHDGKANHGTISADGSGQIKNFVEKTGEGQYANSGVYAMKKDVLDHMPDGPFSLEHDFFPIATDRFSCGAYFTKTSFLDIGTPEQYDLANKIFES